MLRSGSFRTPAGHGINFKDRERFVPGRIKGQQATSLGGTAETALGETAAGEDDLEFVGTQVPEGEDDSVDDDEPSVDSATLAERLKSKGRTQPPVAGQPRYVYCHLCGQPQDLKTFRASHLKVSWAR
mmetsp:Transcript_20325/g.45941  ORF Transcript_20325/g.45941 Transcript_20325/m.45941 type:complete len:128 (-) Transcript_20325:792-1175(-)